MFVCLRPAELVEGTVGCKFTIKAAIIKAPYTDFNVGCGTCGYNKFCALSVILKLYQPRLDKIIRNSRR